MIILTLVAGAVLLGIVWTVLSVVIDNIFRP